MVSFDPQRCSCIDENGTTKIWRGNLPLNAQGHIAYHEMMVAMELDPGTSLVDVCLLDNVKGSERGQWKAEMDAYSVSISQFHSGPNIPPQFNQANWNPARLLGDGVKLTNGVAPGRLVWWQIEGGSDSIVLGPETKSYNFIGLMEFFEVLRMLPTTAVYVHCMNGTDRTGAVVAGYAMRYMGMGLEGALTLASSVPAAGVMSDSYKELVKAYSEWLTTNPTT